jgi:hypothetical protein
MCPYVCVCGVLYLHNGAHSPSVVDSVGTVKAAHSRFSVRWITIVDSVSDYTHHLMPIVDSVSGGFHTSPAGFMVCGYFVYDSFMVWV